MKRYINKIVWMMAVICGLTSLTACEDDAWSNDNPEYET